MSGLQAWDQNGNLVVDLGDFSTRFVTRVAVSIPSGGIMGSAYVPGINGYNSFACVKATNFGHVDSTYAAVTRENAVDVIFLPSRESVAITLYVEIYQFN